MSWQQTTRAKCRLAPLWPNIQPAALHPLSLRCTNPVKTRRSSPSQSAKSFSLAQQALLKRPPKAQKPPVSALFPELDQADAHWVSVVRRIKGYSKMPGHSVNEAAELCEKW
eukprot:Plantae.Rhodophyta-Palmaria_palmata.ctg13038.p1 GENE.Plantae.Rhodophyta-Palmaria_palmata.ctg13038~~Plantae.Rhodophyta-Palmaria_palmata.ctg13038.p1  ORF type:complete len:112 (+),score=1.57 Plantae.Rhodophyta-Palmaria_palmata.ctg13038:706-1041(+)